nr:helix-turn-helix domain-containing protein [Aestuariivirga litoralis]
MPYGQTSGEEAFQQWSETVATVYDLDVARDEIADFRFGFSAWHFGSLVLGVSETDNIEFWRSPQTIARSGIDHYLVQVYEEGSFHSSVEGKDMVVDTGDVWIVDLSRPVKNDQVSFRSTNLAIPRSVLAPLLTDPDSLHGLKLSKDSPTGGLLSRYLTDLSKKAQMMTPDEAASVAQSTVHLIAGCAGPSIDAAELGRDGLSAALLSRIKTGIDSELANPELGADYLCGKFGVSRATLYRLFSSHDGVNTYIRQRRLARCFQELSTPQAVPRRVSEIAEKWGFANEGSFSRTFKQTFGISPSDARDAARRYSSIKTDALGVDSELSQWLKHLMKV